MAAASAITDSLELQLDELGAGEGGSSLKESLKHAVYYMEFVETFANSLVLIVFNELLQFFDVSYGIQVILNVRNNSEM
jgi:hypothetical protein